MTTRPGRWVSRSSPLLAAMCLAFWACDKPSREDYAVAMRWLKCEECVEDELQAVRDRGNALVPILAKALRGPPDDSVANVKVQLASAHVRLRSRGPVPVDSTAYVNHYLSNYRSLYQSRAITGLAAIGTAPALAALEAARDSAHSHIAAFQYRLDVGEELEQAINGRWASISAGLLRTCGIRIDNKSYCWGKNEQGQLGDGTDTSRMMPTLITDSTGAPFQFISIAAADSGDHTCGITVDREAFCWGDNARGELGDGSTTDRLRPTAVAGTMTFVGITTGGDQTCAWTPDYRSFCWGANGAGQLGDGSTTDRLVPTPVIAAIPPAPNVTTELGPTRISAGANHTCADSLNNVLYCWGANDQGQLGDATTVSRLFPTASVTLVRAKALSVGATHTCILAQNSGSVTEGDVYCVGKNDQGQLGDGSTADRNELTKALGPRLLAISAGENHTCGIAVDTRLMYCWGDNHFGQLGTGNPADATSPAQVSGGLAFLAVSAGTGHTCGLTVKAEAYCWGRNADGQVGDTTTTDRLVPVKVVRPEP
jgi:alpha-tubulin suppressor-like RCC1 family protein